MFALSHLLYLWITDLFVIISRRFHLLCKRKLKKKRNLFYSKGGLSLISYYNDVLTQKRKKNVTFGQQISDIKRKHCSVLNGNQNGNFQTFDPRQRDGSNKQLKFFNHTFYAAHICNLNYFTFG